MRLYEYEAKKVFEKAGLITPECFGVIESKKDLENINIKYPVILKSQVLVGGRGKQGGILKAANEKEVNVLTEKLLGLTISNYPVTKIMLEEIVDIKGSCYIGVTMNPSNYNNILMASAEGGVEIETVAKENPDAIYRKEITDNSYTLSEDIAKECAEFLNKKYKKDKKFEKDLAGVITKLYNLYQANECKVAEINPLVITDSEPTAADAKIVLDDNGLFRQLELLEYLGIKEKKKT